MEVYKMSARPCPHCRTPVKPLERLDEIMGADFFVTMTLNDLPERQKDEAVRRSQYCSDECADAAQVVESLKPDYVAQAFSDRLDALFTALTHFPAWQED